MPSIWPVRRPETVVRAGFVQIFITGLPIKNLDKLVVRLNSNDTAAKVRHSALRRMAVKMNHLGTTRTRLHRLISLLVFRGRGRIASRPASVPVCLKRGLYR